MGATRKARFLSIISIFLTYWGFRFVTQAGQSMGTPQNDGYAVTGGIMLVLAGVIAGYTWAKAKELGLKRSSRKELKKSSEQNFQELIEYAKKHEGKKV